MQLKADGVMGIAGCCIAIEVSFILDGDSQLPRDFGCVDLTGLIKIKAKETLSYYDLPKMYADGVHLNSAQIRFQSIPITLTINHYRVQDQLIDYLYSCLDQKNPKGYKVYQAYCKDGNGEEISLNIDLSRSFVFFEEDF